MPLAASPAHVYHRSAVTAESAPINKLPPIFHVVSSVVRSITNTGRGGDGNPRHPLLGAAHILGLRLHTLYRFCSSHVARIGNARVLVDVFSASKAEIFRNVRPADSAYLIIIAGQHGSGKTTLRHLALKEGLLTFPEGLGILDGDGLRARLPKYQDLMVRDPENASNATENAMNNLRHKLIQHGLSHRYNILLERTLREPHEKTLKEFHSRGYWIEIWVLAVGDEASRQGLRSRFQFELEKFGAGRWVPPRQHQHAYERLPGSLRQIQDEGLADCVKLFDRGTTIPFFLSQRNDGEWSNPRSACDALEQRRRQTIGRE
jgi:UDP-N-acetylglucosamine kinase